MNVEIIEVTMHLKPWKGKVSSIVFYANNKDVRQQVIDFCKEYKKEGKFKRRRVTGFSVPFNAVL